MVQESEAAIADEDETLESGLSGLGFSANEMTELKEETGLGAEIDANMQEIHALAKEATGQTTQETPATVPETVEKIEHVKTEEELEQEKVLDTLSSIKDIFQSEASGEHKMGMPLQTEMLGFHEKTLHDLLDANNPNFETAAKTFSEVLEFAKDAPEGSQGKQVGDMMQKALYEKINSFYDQIGGKDPVKEVASLEAFDAYAAYTTKHANGHIELKGMMDTFYKKTLDQSAWFINEITDPVEPNEELKKTDAEQHRLGAYTKHLLNIMNHAEMTEPETWQRAEKSIGKVYRSAEYSDEKQAELPPHIRKYSELYKDSMVAIDQTLAQQTVLRTDPGEKTKLSEEQQAKAQAYQKEMGFQISPAVNPLLEKRAEEIPAEQAWASNELLGSLLKGFGLEPTSMADAWEQVLYDASLNQGRDRMALNVLDNMEKIRAIDQARPGSAKTLHEEFGIRNFSRYADATLIDQYDERDNDTKPYGIIMAGVNDYNGGFQEADRSIEDFRKKLHGKYNLRICEIGGKFGMARRLIGFDQRYGKKQKISFAAIMGHGEEDSVQLGKKSSSWWQTLFNHTQSDVMTSKDLKKEGVQKIKRFFTGNPWFLFYSCSTGAEKGIAQQTGEAYGGGSIGPKKPTSFDVFELSTPVFKGDEIEGFALDKNLPWSKEYVVHSSQAG